MISLLKKDMIISKKPMMFIGLLVLFWGIPAYLIENRIMGEAIFGYCLFFQAYYLAIVLTQKDEAVKADMILNSLPVDRNLVVAERYLYFIIQPTVFSAFIILITGIILAIPLPVFSRGPVFSPMGAMIVMPIIWIALSVFLPLNYLSIGKSKAFNQLSLMALIVLPSILARFFKGGEVPDWIVNLEKIPLEGLVGVLMMFSISLYFISYQISKKIYISKDFY